jgi:hypothetical protein
MAPSSAAGAPSSSYERGFVLFWSSTRLENESPSGLPAAPWLVDGDDGARVQVGVAGHPVVPRIEAVAGLPAVRQAVAVDVRIQRIGFGPLFAGIPDPVGIGVAGDGAVVVLVFAVAVAEPVAVGVGNAGAGFRPIASHSPVGSRARAKDSSRSAEGAVAVHPAVAVGVFHAVGDAA